MTATMIPTAHVATDDDEMTGTLVMRVGYRGGAFAGYAEQPAQRTVAGGLRKALETVFRRSVTLTCAGRTDAGVHAVSQYVSMPVTDAELLLSRNRLLHALTALTPDDMSVRDLYRAGAGFSARFDAVERRYCYRIAFGPRPVLGWGHVWWLRKTPSLDVDAMRAASTCLLGEHDFSSFCKTSSAVSIRADGRSTSRNVTLTDVRCANEWCEDLVVVDIAANAFLHNMVRIVVGTLVEVGRGLRDSDSVASTLAACDRTAAGPTAPPCGLTLQEVTYPTGSLMPW